MHYSFNSHLVSPFLADSSHIYMSLFATLLHICVMWNLDLLNVLPRTAASQDLVLFSRTIDITPAVKTFYSLTAIELLLLLLSRAPCCFYFASMDTLCTSLVPGTICTLGLAATPAFVCFIWGGSQRRMMAGGSPRLFLWSNLMTSMWWFV